MKPTIVSIYQDSLPSGIRTRFVNNSNGLNMHVLEAGYESTGRPLALLLHGFPELAWSWRHVMPALADNGWHVVAPDQRGYGLTYGCDDSINNDFDGDLAKFRLLNLVRDTIGLVFGLGYRHVDTLVGHDFGAILAPWCVLTRADVFRSLVIMSAPFAGPPKVPVDSPYPVAARGSAAPVPDIHLDLASLARPRKHYQWYYSTREANADMLHCEQGVHDFMRAYYHVKSADLETNKPHALRGWTAPELAKLPTYYVMDLEQNMATTVAPNMPSGDAIAACNWLSDDALSVYADSFSRTGYQGGLNWYRGRTCGRFDAELQIFDGCTIDVPSMFIAGAADWGMQQTPGALELMQTEAFTQLRGCHVVDGAGHWLQQEQPQAVNALLAEFMHGLT